jgi:hypothetical protein
MSTKDPKSDRDYPQRTRDKLSKGTVFELPCGGRIEYRKTKRTREPTGQTTYVAKFDVVRESQGEYSWVFGPTYTTTEYLALSRIDGGSWEVIN